MSRKQSCEIIVRERGPEGWPALTLELDFPYQPDFGRSLVERLPGGTRIWSGGGDEKWHCHPDFVEQIAEIAYEFFPRVYFTEGTSSVEIRSGWRRPEQAAMF